MSALPEGRGGRCQACRPGLPAGHDGELRQCVCTIVPEFIMLRVPSKARGRHPIPSCPNGVQRCGLGRFPRRTEGGAGPAERQPALPSSTAAIWAATSSMLPSPSTRRSRPLQ